MVYKKINIKKETEVNILSKRNQKGFTLIELLVVIAIIGLLASVVLLSLNSARQKSRDAKRVADMRQIASALELYYNDCGGYPSNSAGTTLTTAVGLYSGAISAAGVCGAGITGTATGTTYIAQFPTAPTPVESGCTAGGNDYFYTSAGSTTYSVRFCLGAATGSYSAGTKTLSQTGIQ